MRTRMWMLVAGATLALVAALALPSLSWAQTPGGGPGRGPGRGMMGGQEQSLVAVAAQVLGIPQADLVAQLQSGKTIADVAGDKAGAIVEAFVQPRAERLAAMVTAGRLTQAEAEQRVATMRAQVTARLSQPWSAHGPGFVDADGDGVCDHAGAGMGRGRMGAGRAGQ